MSLERSEVAVCGQVPEFDGLVVACADQDFAVRRDSQAADPACVAGEGFLLDDLRHFEQLDRAVPAAGDQHARVRREGHGADPVIHRLLKSAVVFDVVAARFGGVFDASLPMPVVQHFFLAARQDFPDLDLPDVGAVGEVSAVG